MSKGTGISSWKLLIAIILVLLPGFLSLGFRVLYSHVSAFQKFINSTGLSPTNWAFIIGIIGFIFGVYYLSMALHNNQIVFSAPFKNLLKIFFRPRDKEEK